MVSGLFSLSIFAHFEMVYEMTSDRILLPVTVANSMTERGADTNLPALSMTVFNKKGVEEKICSEFIKLTKEKILSQLIRQQ